MLSNCQCADDQDWEQECFTQVKGGKWAGSKAVGTQGIWMYIHPRLIENVRI